MPRSLDRALRQRILDHLATPAGESQTLAEIAQKFTISIWAAHKLRKFSLAHPPEKRPGATSDLYNVSTSPEPGGQLFTTGDELLAAASSNPKLFIDRVLSGGATTLSTDQQRAALSELILHTPNPSIKVAAQNALTRLDAQAGGTVALGPGAPLTEIARADRLALLMQACGLITVRTALKIAFPRARALLAALHKLPQDADGTDDQGAEADDEAPTEVAQ